LQLLLTLQLIDCFILLPLNKSVFLEGSIMP
jgi:hypothetical protein